ncbi:sensor histidine kinase [Streptomyces sp. ODS05-4]|uniref:sensor histidine kinase n=1 Tax=Streptomyces sp. ODS05-4 TaxID=2944939 RepID=UPI0035B2E219
MRASLPAALRGARPHRDDVLIAAGGLAVGLLLWSLGLYTTGPKDQRPLSAPWLVPVPLAVMAALELVRRSRPRFALAAGTVAVVLDTLTRGNLATVILYADLVYAAVVYGPPATARRLPVFMGMLSIALTVGYLAWYRDAPALLAGLVTALVTFVPAISGAVVRNHREAADAARLRAGQTALLAEMDRVQAVAAERARMARELHDVVAGHLSAIAIHATAALSLDDERTTREAMGVVRENSVAGLAEMRRLIGLLRDGGEPAEPSAVPTLAGLEALVRQAGVNGAAGGLVFALEGGPVAGVRLPAPVELAAYRIVQESLTNALKHAVPGAVTVSLTASGRALEVRVDSPCGERPGPRAPGSGAGLIGMRERVALLDGVFEAGPVAGGGAGASTVWRVRAELPVAEEDGEPAA